MVKVISVLLILLLLFWLGYWLLEARLGPVILEMARVRATTIATRAINNSVTERIAKSILYDRLVYTETDSQGKITLIQVNTGEVNRIASDTSLSVQDTLKDLSNQELYIPLGQVIGGKVLASRGPLIPIKIIPIGTVETSVSEEFIEKGINQTLYRLSVEIKARVRIVVPLVSAEALVSTLIPVINVIVPGTVPDVYFGTPLNELINKQTN